MRKILCIFLLCLPLFCAGQGEGPLQPENLLLEFNNSEFKIYRNLEKVPKSFFRYFNRNGWNLKMVEYGKDYNNTDIQTDLLPNAMLIELGVSENNLFVLLFDHGGYGVARRAFIFKPIKKKFIVKELLLERTVDSIAILKEYCKQGVCKFL